MGRNCDNSQKSPLPVTGHQYHRNTVSGDKNETIVIPSTAVVEYATTNQKNSNNNHTICCATGYDRTTTNVTTTTTTTTKKKPSPQSHPESLDRAGTNMADIPLRHSSHTRTLLPGLRRKSSIRRASRRSRWYTIVPQHRFVSSCFSTGRSIIDSSTSSSDMKRNATSTSTTTQPVIHPPKHTQRILKYDPRTGNAYDSNISNSRHNNFIHLSVFGMISRNKVLLSIWKLTLLVSFAYINLNLFQLQQEHHHISQILSSMTNTDPYQPRSSTLYHLNDYHHRALRGSMTLKTTTTTTAVTTTTVDGRNESGYNTNHNHRTVISTATNRSDTTYHSTSTTVNDNHPHHNAADLIDDVPPTKSYHTTFSPSTMRSSGYVNNNNINHNNIGDHTFSSQQQPRPETQHDDSVVGHEEPSSLSSNQSHDKGRVEVDESTDDGDAWIETISIATAMQ